jgi:hypothetical protein
LDEMNVSAVGYSLDVAVVAVVRVVL